MHHAPADCINAPGEATAESGRMALELTDAELATAATACRAMAYQEGERAHRSSHIAPARRQVLAPSRCGDGYELTPDNLVLAERGRCWRCRQW